jgi:hypothetical protein
VPHDPMLVDGASLPPGFCFTCGTVEGPFVDTMCSANHDTARVYLCVRSCVTRFAALAGLSDAAELQTQLADALADIDSLAEWVAIQAPLVDAVTTAVAKIAETPEPVIKSGQPLPVGWIKESLEKGAPADPPKDKK